MGRAADPRWAPPATAQRAAPAAACGSLPPSLSAAAEGSLLSRHCPAGPASPALQPCARLSLWNACGPGPAPRAPARPRMERAEPGPPLRPARLGCRLEPPGPAWPRDPGPRRPARVDMRLRELSLRQDPDLRQELAALARGCDFVLPSRFKKRLKAFQQVRVPTSSVRPSVHCVCVPAGDLPAPHSSLARGPRPLRWGWGWGWGSGSARAREVCRGRAPSGSRSGPLSPALWRPTPSAAGPAPTCSPLPAWNQRARPFVGAQARVPRGESAVCARVWHGSLAGRAAPGWELRGFGRGMWKLSPPGQP